MGIMSEGSTEVAQSPLEIVMVAGVIDKRREQEEERRKRREQEREENRWEEERRKIGILSEGSVVA